MVYGMLFGFTLQFGLGPVNLATWLIGAEKGWKRSLQVALGVSLVDWLYIISAFFLKSGLTGVWTGFLLLFSASYLGYMGYKSFKAVASNKQVIEGNLFLFGFKLNLMNPKALILWVSVISSLEATFSFVLGIPFSTIIWLGLVPVLFRFPLINKGMEKVTKHKNLIMGSVFSFYALLGLWKAILFF